MHMHTGSALVRAQLVKGRACTQSGLSFMDAFFYTNLIRTTVFFIVIH